MRDIDLEELDDECDEDNAKAKRYVLKEFDSRLDALGALYALRIVRNARVYRRVFERQSYIDDDVLALLGVASATKRSQARHTRCARRSNAKRCLLRQPGLPVGMPWLAMLQSSRTS